MLQEYFQIPKSCYINRKIPKKAFIDTPEFDLKKEEKELLKNAIESIYFQYSLSPSNLNIPKYEDEEIRYEEIEIIKVKLNHRDKENKVCNLIQKYIPYPIIILLEYRDFIKINVAIKKINKVEREKLSIEEMIYTSWINLNEPTKEEKAFLESLNINNIWTNNLFQLYKSYVNNINSLDLSKYTKEFEIKPIETLEIDMELLEEIKTLESKVTELRNKIKKESNYGKKVSLNVEVRKLKDKIKDLKENLK
ncbi:DUF4391 domain-containing protein [Clostridium tarantellae]|uniref:DUF4391 family protein n=1 Tax=Clostridium tarantellae TaxID=39493 RepID=A0A6I1MSB9_9CLOT|nr:DUF4391 domain-containing protein [Clostridium tarantellae]MPQ43159.1 DUF4391 family protein [Clostridium tarantellae]